MGQRHILRACVLAALGLLLLAGAAAGQQPGHAPLLPIPASVPHSDLAEHDAGHGLGDDHGHDHAHSAPTGEALVAALAFSPQGCGSPSAAPTVQGVTPLAPGGVLCTGISFNADLDSWERGGRRFVAQGGGTQAAFIITEVTDPTAPVVRRLFTWADYGRSGNGTYAPDIKHFTQAGRDYLALSVERLSGGQIAGILIIDVADPAQPVVLWHLTGDITGTPFDGRRWYDVHNLFIETENGEGAFLWLTNDNNRDVRVLDIRNLSSLTPGNTAGWMGREVGRWSHPDGYDAVGFMHDITVLRGRAYFAYWEAGVVIVPSVALHGGVFTGAAAAQVALHPLHALDPALPPGAGNGPSFVAHHAFPTRDGQWLFTQDESSTGMGGHVYLWDLRNLPSVPSGPSAIIELGGQSRTHNLNVVDGRLYVGWYGNGLRAFDIDLRDPAAPIITPTLTHALRALPQSGYNGAWGVRPAPCTVAGQPSRCLYTSDIEFGLMVDREDLPPPCRAADQECDGDVDVRDVQAVASVWRTAIDQDAAYRPAADLDADGDVDVRDIQLAARAWGG